MANSVLPRIFTFVDLRECAVVSRVNKKWQKDAKCKQVWTNREPFVFIQGIDSFRKAWCALVPFQGVVLKLSGTDVVSSAHLAAGFAGFPYKLVRHWTGAPLVSNNIDFCGSFLTLHTEHAPETLLAAKQSFPDWTVREATANQVVLFRPLEDWRRPVGDLLACRRDGNSMNARRKAIFGEPFVRAWETARIKKHELLTTQNYVAYATEVEVRQPALAQRHHVDFLLYFLSELPQPSSLFVSRVAITGRREFLVLELTPPLPLDLYLRVLHWP